MKQLSCLGLLVVMLSAQAQVGSGPTMANPCIGLTGNELMNCLVQPIPIPPPNHAQNQTVSLPQYPATSTMNSNATSPAGPNTTSCNGLQGSDLLQCVQKLVDTKNTNPASTSPWGMQSPPPAPLYTSPTISGVNQVLTTLPLNGNSPPANSNQAYPSTNQPVKQQWWYPLSEPAANSGASQ